MDVDVVVLAAGKGERLKSSIPKPLHKICGATLIELVLEVARTVTESPIVVVGYGADEVRKVLDDSVVVVEQKEQLGTADAVKVALPAVKKSHLLVLYADVPLVRKETVVELIKEHIESSADVTLLTTVMEFPTGYGRIIRSESGEVSYIVEEAELNDEKRDSLKEVFTGIAVYKVDFLEDVLPMLKRDNRKGEFYLTDVVRSAERVRSVECEAEEALGVNDKGQLILVESIFQERIQEELMERGARIVAPHLVFIEYGVEVEGECLVEPFSVIRRGARIGRGCVVGPFSHLRSGTVLKEGSEVGNFVETKKTVLGEGAKAKHLSYLGDAEIGAGANIGAGTICANYDGVRKHKTVIEEGAQIGSGSVLVAPVRIGKGAVTGAGAVVTKGRDVADGETVVGGPARPMRRRKKRTI